MKNLLLLILLVPAFCFSQSIQTQKTKYLLLDRNWSKPVKQSDTVMAADLKEGWLPIYSSDLDSLENLIRQFKNIKKDGENRKYYNQDDFKSEKFTLQISSAKYAYADRYDITIYSITDAGKISFKIADMGSTVNQAQSTVNSILFYLKSTRKYISLPLHKQKPQKFGY